ERDLRTVCARLGYRLTLNPSSVPYNGKRNATFRGELRFERSGHRNEKSMSEIVAIHKARCREVYDIGVEGEPHLFSLASGVLTHNSKPNPMPESVRDRPTESHEYILMLTKSGTTQYWTHRDGGGTRQRPKPDYRWVNQITQEEVAIEPTDWKVKVKCPKCLGGGTIGVYLGLDVWQTTKCPTCNGKKETQIWKRINLWRGHDYYWDADAVREEYTEPMNRWGGETLKRDTSKTAAYKEMQNIGYSSAFRVGRPMRPDPSGRNIRSVWEFPTKSYPEA
ncbi:unnamed protein product, partial [marine sediment metagenome]